MKLTKLSAAWLQEWTCRLMPAPARMDAGTASQLIPGVRRTMEGAMAGKGRRVVECVLGFAIVASIGASGGQREPEPVSIVQLLATPARYEGRLVQVRGVAHFEFEESALYLHREDADHMNSANGLWLEAGGHDDLSDVFVLVEGRFTARSHGHLGAWPGEIDHVTRLERAGTRKDYSHIPPPPPARQ